MSNQRSFVLFVALVFIVSYLYYESSLKKQEPLDSHFDNNSSNFEKLNIYRKRDLLSYSIEDRHKDFPRIATNTEVSDHINRNTTNSKKRLTRQTPIEEEFLNWKFHVNITKLDKGSKKLTESEPSVLKSNKSEKGNSLNMAVFVEGEEAKNSSTELQRAWGAVGEFLRSFFGSTPEQLKENHKILVEGSNFLDQLAKTNKKNPIDKGKENQTRGKEPKFLTSLLFPSSQAGGNKENPPLELGSGEIQNLSLDSLNVSRDNEIDSATDKEFFPIKNLLSEEEFENEKATLLNSTLENTETSFNPLSEILNDLTPNMNFSATDAVLEIKPSAESEIPNQGLDTLFKVVTVTDLPGKTVSDLENFCFHLLRNVTKSPKFLEEFAELEGSGSFSDETENSELNIKSDEITTQTSSPEPQLSRFQSLWNQVLRFRFRNGQRAAKMFDTLTDVPSQSIDLEEMNSRFFINGLFNDLGSGGRLNSETDEVNFLENKDTDEILKDISIEDCKEVFLTKETNHITTEGLLLTENVIQPEIKSSSFKINNLSSDNLIKDADNLQDNVNLTMVFGTETNDFKSMKVPVETTTFPNSDSIAKLEEKIQELINSIGKDDSFQTQDSVTIILKTTSSPKAELLFNKEISKDTVSNEVSVSEFFRVNTQSFNKDLNDSDITPENILLNNLEEHKIVSRLDTYEDSYIENKEEFIDTDLLPVSTVFPLSEQNQRIFPIFMSGSGSREIKDALSTSEINLNTNEDSFDLFDLGSGERKIDETEHFTDMTTIRELSKFNFNNESNEYFDETDTFELSTIGNLKSSNIDSKNFTVQETEINGTILRIFDTGDGKEISIHTNSNQNEFNCINCSEIITPIPFDCTNCEETSNPLALEDSSKPDSYINYENQISVNSAIRNTIPPSNQKKVHSYNEPTLKPELIQISETCTNCEPLKTETSVNYIIPKNQIKVTSPDRIEFKKENEPTITTPKFEVYSANFDSKEIDILNFQSNKSNGNNDNKISSLNDLGGEEFNNSRTQFARNNDVPSRTPILSRRGARAHNALPPNWPEFFDTRPKTLTPILQSTVSAQSITEETSKMNIPKEFTEIQYDSTTTVKAINTASDIATEFETSTLIDFLDNFTIFASTSKTHQTEDTNTTDLSQLYYNVSTVLSTSETITKPDLSINPRAKIPKRFCTSASECNVTLNERCISNHGITACDCGRTFKRHPESKKCEATITLKTSLRLPGEVFHGDLRDRSSELFRKKEEQSLETMWLLLEHDPALFLIVAEISIDRFDEGSLVVNWNIKLVTDGNETVSELANQINEDLKEVIGNLDSFSKLPLNVQNASVSTYAVNPCETRELNYCHKSAECILDEAVGFRCKCNMGYVDNSKDKSYPGEVCIEFCYPNECGDHGECKLKTNGEKHCLCSGWFFGEKCEISGIVVIASFAGANILIVLALFIAACVCRRRRNRSYYNRNVTRFQPGQDIENSVIRTQRVADAIALSEVGPSKISKYVNVSTPLFDQGPIIQVTSPSFTGSSIDYDSTFDRSPCSEENSRRDSVTTSKC